VEKLDSQASSGRKKSVVEDSSSRKEKEWHEIVQNAIRSDVVLDQAERGRVGGERREGW